jgi:subtilase family serine protease
VGNPVQAAITWTVKNQGNASTSSQWTDRLMLSTNAVAGDADDVTVISFVHNGVLAPNAEYSDSRTVTLPSNLDGHYYLFVRTDVLNQVAEFQGETNNVSALAPIDVAIPYADLVVEAVSAPATALSGDPIQVSWRVRNVGIAQTNASSWTDRLYLSSDGTFDGSDTLLGSITRSGTLAVDASYTGTTTFTLPEGISGNFHVFAVADAVGQVFEKTFESNNTGRTITPIAVSLKPAPDLVVNSVTGPTSENAGQLVTVNWTVTNNGPGVAKAFWLDYVYLSSTGSLTGATLLGSVAHSTDLAAGGTYNASANVNAPSVVDGTYRFIVVTDGGGVVFEGANESNNSTVSDPTQVTHPDLTVALLSPPTQALSGDSITIRWRVTNSGTGPAGGQWTDRVFLSTDNVVSGADVVMGSVTHTGLAAGASFDAEIN